MVVILDRIFATDMQNDGTNVVVLKERAKASHLLLRGIPHNDDEEEEDPDGIFERGSCAPSFFPGTLPHF